MKTILIAYDGSECAEALIAELQRAGLPSQLEAHVVSVAGGLGAGRARSLLGRNRAPMTFPKTPNH